MSAEIVMKPCRWCQRATSVATLGQYGARCFECYEAYLLEPLPRASVMANRHTQGDRGWAHALRKRELAVEPLTPFQRQAWRDALGHQAFEGAEQ